MNTVKSLLKPVYNDVRNIFIDSHLRAKGTPPISITNKVKITYKHRLAESFGIHLTDNEKRFNEFHNKHKGERCFIIGNGPSLNKVDLKLLKNEITFGVNAIYTNYEKMGFFPTYYVVEDTFVAEDRKDEINKLKGPTKFFGNYLKYCFEEAPDTIWVNVRFRYDDYKDFPNFSTSALRQVWTGGTVTYLNLQLAYYMGFSEVYMVGFDHSYSIPKEAIVSGTEIVSTGDDVNHFNSSYFGKGLRWHDPMVDRMEASYRKAKKYYELDERKIYNATVGGNLEVFERVDYNQLF